MQTRRLQTVEQIRSFLEGNELVEFEPAERKAAYELVNQTLRRFVYARLGRAEKGLIRRYLCKLTGLSRAQVTRLIAQFRKTGRIRDRRDAPAKPFPRRYTSADILLLAEVDALHGTLSGPATRKLCERAYTVFGDSRFERLADISNGHLYNLRQSQTYRRRRGTVDKTRPIKTNIGERRKPFPEGRPGFLRVDSIHQGDLDGVKGLYHINLIDEVTQFQFVGSVERKHLGYAHIPGRFAGRVNHFTQQTLSPYLNFHRPCFYPKQTVDVRGRLRKRYRYEDMMTPYDKLKSLPDASQYLKQGLTFEHLDAIAHAMSDNDAASLLNRARAELFRSINNAQTPAA